MTSCEKLLLENKAWAKEMKEDDPEFFSRLEQVQSPEFLWIGCSDSRIPANQITNTLPGEIFVHRNIANLVVNTDVNMLSVLHYAVEVLKVKHVIVCGHYGCGGVKAALTTNDYKQALNMWLRNIKDIYQIHRAELEAVPDGDERLNKLIELTVQEQVINLSKTSIIQKAWAQDASPDLHGWVYNLADGLIKPVFEMQACSRMDPAYEYNNFH